MPRPVIVIRPLTESSWKYTTGIHLTSIRGKSHSCESKSSTESILLQCEHLTIGELFADNFTSITKTT